MCTVDTRQVKTSEAFINKIFENHTDSLATHPAVLHGIFVELLHFKCNI